MDTNDGVTQGGDLNLGDDAKSDTGENLIPQSRFNKAVSNAVEKEREKFSSGLQSEREARIRLEEQLKQVSDPIKSEIKSIDAELNQENQLIDQGGYEVEEDLFFFFDRTEAQAVAYNKQGLLVISRPMTEKELNNPELKLVD